MVLSTARFLGSMTFLTQVKMLRFEPLGQVMAPSKSVSVRGRPSYVPCTTVAPLPTLWQKSLGGTSGKGRVLPVVLQPPGKHISSSEIDSL